MCFIHYACTDKGFFEVGVVVLLAEHVAVGTDDNEGYFNISLQEIDVTMVLTEYTPFLIAATIKAT